MSGTFWHGITLAKCQAPRAARTCQIKTVRAGCALRQPKKSPIRPFPKYRELFVSMKAYLDCALCCFGAFGPTMAVALAEWISECIWTQQLNHVTYTAWHYSFSLRAQTSRQPLPAESAVSPSACIFKQTEVDRRPIRNGCVSLRDSEHNQKARKVIKEHATWLLSQCICTTTSTWVTGLKKKSVLVLQYESGWLISLVTWETISLTLFKEVKGPIAQD